VTAEHISLSLLAKFSDGWRGTPPSCAFDYKRQSMKVFLLSDLVVHELVSMQLEGKWLTSEQFSESARL
jgi:hypothetical protein